MLANYRDFNLGASSGGQNPIGEDEPTGRMDEDDHKTVKAS